MEFLEIMKPGLLSTIQDLGRESYQFYGVSACGAMDKLSLRFANILVGNDQDEAAIEVTLLGPKITFMESGIIAITGANLSPKMNGKSIPMWHALPVSRGDVLSFGHSADGCCRAYIAIAGGIDVPKIMGSRSTFTRGKFGGLDGRALKEGDRLSIGLSKCDPRFLVGRSIPTKYIPNFKDQRPIRFILGPQADAFTEEAIQTFTAGPYQILNESDRMGYRLEGAVINHCSGPDIISDYIITGSIQVPGSGQPIVLMSDCQMTGGYTKIGAVIGVDIPYLAQKKPGDQIHFEKIDIEQAQLLWKQQEQFMSILQINNQFV